MRLYRLVRHENQVQLLLTEAAKPQPKRDEVLIKIEAASLNYRDLIVMDGVIGGGNQGLIPLSDAVGRIEAVGPDVSRWRGGERVATLFFRDWAGGPFHERYFSAALGGNGMDGVLAEYVVLQQGSVIAAPEHLSAAEAATLPCAGVTAWQALFPRGGLGRGDTLLVQGTGGVALFALQFAQAIGARTIVLSSSDDKLARAQKLGASILLNYQSAPDWDRAVMDATGGVGATHILELGGPATYDRSIRSVAAGGKIAQIGVLTGFGPQPNLGRLQNVNADILGICVGSGEHFAAMNTFIAEKRIVPVIDCEYPFENAAEAYARLRSGQHFGKIVVVL